MNKPVAIILILAGFWFLMGRGGEGKTRTAGKPTPVTKETGKPKARQPAQTPGAATVPAAGPVSEAKSLEEMAATLARFAKPKSTVRDLVELLQEQKPVVTFDKNPASGEMAIVRTQRPLPGTRYFHAQFFNGEDGEPFVQHMSFEYKPGPAAMNAALSAVQTAFGVNQPRTSREGYALWDLPDGHILWVKKLDAEDLNDDPFNAYDSKDVGTVRVVIEAEIH